MAAVTPSLTVFISYSRKDREFAERLEVALGTNQITNIQIRRDHQLYYGDKWWPQLIDFIAEADCAVFIVSRASIISVYCAKEVREVEKLSKRIVSIFCDDIPYDDPDLKKLPELTAYQLPPRGLPFEQKVDHLVDALVRNYPWNKDRVWIDAEARTWDSHQRASELLLRGPKLDLARMWAALPVPPKERAIDPVTTEFLSFSDFWAGRDRHFALFRAGRILAMQAQGEFEAARTHYHVTRILPFFAPVAAYIASLASHADPLLIIAVAVGCILLPLPLASWGRTAMRRAEASLATATVALADRESRLKHFKLYAAALKFDADENEKELKARELAEAKQRGERAERELSRQSKENKRLKEEAQARDKAERERSRVSVVPGTTMPPPQEQSRPVQSRDTARIAPIPPSIASPASTDRTDAKAELDRKREREERESGIPYP